MLPFYLLRGARPRASTSGGRPVGFGGGGPLKSTVPLAHHTVEDTRAPHLSRAFGLAHRIFGFIIFAALYHFLWHWIEGARMGIRVPHNFGCGRRTPQA